MSASIGGATTTSSGLAEAFDSARPQVQSRRVSLKLGPLGITYSTDQVLWGAAASAAACASAGGTGDAISAPAGGLLGSAADADAARREEAAQAAQTEALQTGRGFSQEMFQAWRRQVAQRQEHSATYGPDGALKGAAAVAADSGVADSGDDDAVEAIAASSAATDEETQTQVQRAGVTPVSRMRRAIAAYLACEAAGGSGSMLSAVA